MRVSSYAHKARSPEQVLPRRARRAQRSISTAPKPNPRHQAKGAARRAGSPPSQARSATAAKHRAGGSSVRPAPLKKQAYEKQRYPTPSLWTKDAPKAGSSPNPLLRSLVCFSRFLLSLLVLIGHGLKWTGRSFVSLVAHNRAALVVTVVVALLAAGFLVDAGVNGGRAYAGVSIGTVDVSGKTADEMRDLVEQAYAGRLDQGSVTIYATDDAAARAAHPMAGAEDEALAEQRSVEEARRNKLLWTTDASSLGATLPVDDLVNEALAVGREDGGIAARFDALLHGRAVAVRASYDEQALESLAADIDATIGEPRVDYGMTLADGKASVTEGHAGYMVDRSAFSHKLDQAFLEDSPEDNSFVARVSYTPLRIDKTAAQQTCDRVNDAIASGARFVYQDATWDASATDVGGWVASRIEETDNGWSLIPFLDESHAKSAILTHVQQSNGDAVKVSFERQGNEVMVHTEGSGDIPLVSETVQALDDVLFGETGSEASPSDGTGNAHAQRPDPGQPVEVAVGSGPAPAETTFDEALGLGLITDVSSFTTAYTSGAGTENRNHNIHLVSDMLSDSIVKPGENWSFNGTAGDCDEEKGFLGAGAIIDGEYDDAVGGGICQVATTMFNAVYNSGYPVLTRHNHTLYMSSYPMGRDAAVSWPDLDLVWKNDGTSDILVRLAYTNSTVTVTLYGVDPGYQVHSTVGKWVEGKKHATRVERDDGMSRGTSYTKTAGTDGKSITVVRTVSAADGTVLHEDTFDSTYDPVTKVIVAAPDAAVSPDKRN